MGGVLTDIRGFLLASRIPNLLLVGAVQWLVALYLLKEPLDATLTISFFGLIVSTVCIAAAGYIINDYYDQKIDMINRPEKVIVGIKFKRLSAILAHSTLNISAIIVGFWIHPLIGAAHTLSAFLLWYYSNYLRRLPFLGNLIIAGLSGMVVLIVSAYFRHYNDLITIYVFFASIVVLIREVIKDIIDVKGDVAFGCETIPVIWGVRGAKAVIYLASITGMSALATFLVEFNSPSVSAYFLIISPFFVLFLVQLYRADTHAQFKTLRTFSNWIIFSGLISILFLR